MERRDVLRASGVTLAVALGGCAGEDGPGTQSTTATAKGTTTAEGTTTEARETTEETETTETAETTEATETTETTETTKTTEATETPEETTTVGPAETQYDLGTTHVNTEWEFSVAEFEVTKQFQTNDGESYEMPEGEKLGIATIEAENQGSVTRGWSGMLFAVIFKGRAYEKQRDFSHPAFSDGVVMDELKGIETARQYQTSAYPVDPGETVTTWELFVLPADATREQVTVGFDDGASDGLAYPIRWIPN